MTIVHKLQFAALMLLAAGLSGKAAADSLNVTFLHINDHHSHFDPNFFDVLASSVPEGLSVNASSGVRVYYGGASHVAGTIKELAELALSQGNEVVKVHGGDAITGTMFFGAFGGEPDAVFMNGVGFDAFVPGNHEFNNGDGELADFLKMLRFPVTSYNLNAGADSPLNSVENLKKYIVKTFETGEQIGMCGMTPRQKTMQSSFPSPGTTIEDEVVATKSCVADLQADGINKIVIVSHVGFDQDQNRLAKIDGVDVIIGGDSHTLLGINASSIGGPSSRYDYATIVNNVCIVQSWEYQKVVGELTVSWDEDGNVLGCVGTPYLPYNQEQFTVISESGDYDLTNESDIKIMGDFLSSQPNFRPAIADQNVSTGLQMFYDQLEGQLEIEIAIARDNMCHNRGQGDIVPVKCSDFALQTKVGGGVCQIVAQSFLFKVPTAEFAIQNSGGCRTDINQGSFTIGNVYEILPFSNTLVTLNLTGSQIKNVLEDAFENFLNTTIGGSAGSFPNAAGLRWTADYTQPFGNRVSNLEMSPRHQTEEWFPIVFVDKYTVVTNNFIAMGRDGYTTFAEAGEYTQTFIDYAQSLLDYAIDQEELVTPPKEWFSSQKITFANGEVADLASASGSDDAQISETNTTEADLGDATTKSSGAQTFHILGAWFMVALFF